MKHFLYLSLLFALISCGSSGQEVKQQSERTAPSEQSAKQDTLKRPQQQEGNSDSSNVQKQDRSKKEGLEKWRRPHSLEMHGVWRQGRFRWYQPATKDQKSTASYGGRPKVEVLGKDDEVIKTIDVIDYQKLYGAFDSISFIGAHSPYKVNLKNPKTAEDFAIYRDILPQRNSRDIELSLRCRHEYHYNEGVLWIVTVCYAMEFDVIGAKTEVIGVDDVGNEIGRLILEGIANLSYSGDNQFIAATVGGTHSERAEYSHPMSFSIYNINDEKQLYKYYADNDESISGGIVRGKAILDIYNKTDFNHTDRGVKEVIVVDYEDEYLCELNINLFEKYGKGIVGKYENHIEYRSNGEPIAKYYFDKDFSCRTILD